MQAVCSNIYLGSLMVIKFCSHGSNYFIIWAWSPIHETETQRKNAKYCVIGFSFLLIENKSNGYQLSENGGGAHNASFAAWKDFTGSWSVHVPGHIDTVMYDLFLHSARKSKANTNNELVQFRLVKFWKIIFPFNKLFFKCVLQGCNESSRRSWEGDHEGSP